MERQLSIYVSASPEMDEECELLGQLLANITRSVRWTFKRTPGPHLGENPDLDSLRASQFYLILLGMDIVAPIGVEYRAAREQDLAILAFRNIETSASPAAAYFAQNMGIRWRAFRTPQDFIGQFERDLLARLIEGTPGYGLDLNEIERLSVRLEALREEDAQDHKSAESDTRRGAGGGGIILPNGASNAR